MKNTETIKNTEDKMRNLNINQGEGKKGDAGKEFSKTDELSHRMGVVHLMKPSRLHKKQSDNTELLT